MKKLAQTQERPETQQCKHRGLPLGQKTQWREMAGGVGGMFSGFGSVFTRAQVSPPACSVSS